MINQTSVVSPLTTLHRVALEKCIQSIKEDMLQDAFKSVVYSGGFEIHDTGLGSYIFLNAPNEVAARRLNNWIIMLYVYLMKYFSINRIVVSCVTDPFNPTEMAKEEGVYTIPFTGINVGVGYWDGHPHWLCAVTLDSKCHVRT